MNYILDCQNKTLAYKHDVNSLKSAIGTIGDLLNMFNMTPPCQTYNSGINREIIVFPSHFKTILG
jgi:hypothetical protein